MAHLEVIERATLDQLISKRPGETKLGETVHTFPGARWEETLKDTTAHYVLVGIPEDIGVRANLGVGGAATLWQPTLKAILNVQDTDMLQGNKLAVLGAFRFDEWMAEAPAMSVDALRELVAQIDDVVAPVISKIAAAGKVPIVIGGGHNNAYPILKGISKAKGGSVNCINLDAHSDYRAIEGRHSGNGFRYAKMDGYLGRYAAIGLHHNYNSQAVLNDLAADRDIHFCFFEDIFLLEQTGFDQAVDDAVRFAAGAPIGLELDLDCIENVLSSAATPCGISTLQARKFITACCGRFDAAYLHITEGSVQLEDGRTNSLTAKLVAYLVTDFMRYSMNRHPVFIRDSELY